MLDKLYVSLKARPFVMVLGRGSTDMAALSRAFAKSVGAEDRYLELQVPTDWMDSSDLFGHLDLMGKFVPGAIIDFLKRAQHDPERDYFLCLDGINLSRAEYYLREVVASVEQKLPLVPEIYYGRDEAALEKYGRIPALSNLYIVGTSNLDYASLPLNQKLLDRVHTIYLRDEKITAEPKTYDLTCRYENVGNCLEQARKYFPLFEELNKILMLANAYVGFRMRNDGILWLLNNDVLEESTAIDHVICQKVLTRVQGSQKVLPVLEGLLEFCKERYPRAERAICRMMENCKAGGFASYWD